jgi:hypothetical protein
LVRLKLAAAAAPVAEAVTVIVPAVVLAVNDDEVATPLEFVITVSVAVEFETNMPLAPDAGAVNVTATPLAGDPPFVTVATSELANAVPTVVFCPPPLVAAITSGGGGGVELEPQPVKKPNAPKLRAKTLQQAIRFIGSLLPVWLSLCNLQRHAVPRSTYLLP